MGRGVPYILKITEIDPETLCQYTGLTDKNGERIWENDIVSFIDVTSTENGYWERDCVGRVAWDFECVCFRASGTLSAESWEVLQDCIVQGNIFDNPELLQEMGEVKSAKALVYQTPTTVMLICPYCDHENDYECGDFCSDNGAPPDWDYTKIECEKCHRIFQIDGHDWR